MKTSPTTLTTEEGVKLLNTLKNENGTTKQRVRGIRNHCMALLMLDAGLRVGEVVRLRSHHLYFNSQPVTSIIILPDIAKNKTERTIPVSQRLTDALKEHYQDIQYYGNSLEPCFVFHHGRPHRPLTTRQVERTLCKAAMKSIGHPVHPHVLRHTFASRLMRTTNARVVQELLGHKHLSTTQIYTHPNQDDMKNAIQSLEPKPPKIEDRGQSFRF